MLNFLQSRVRLNQSFRGQLLSHMQLNIRRYKHKRLSIRTYTLAYTWPTKHKIASKIENNRLNDVIFLNLVHNYVQELHSTRST